MSFRLGHRPALDGVRGFAILSVMAVHSGADSFVGGYLGVDVFFVLSGFLITSILLREWSSGASINLRNFYVRRALRLLPGLAVLLLCLGIFSYFIPPYFPGAAVELRREIVFTFFYVTNWALAFGAMPALGLLGHAWTLAIEEQFYLLWPIVLLSMLRAGFSRRSVAIAAAAGIVASALLRLWMWERGATVDRLFFGFDTRCDTLLVGCLAGIYVTFPDRHTPLARRATRLAGAAGVAALALMLVVTSHDDPFLFRGGFTLIAAAAAGIVLNVVDHPDGMLARVLAWRPLVHLGDISYGLYLWHWPVFLSLVPSELGMSPLATNVTRFAATLALAEMSAVLVERPFLRLKSRWE